MKKTEVTQTDNVSDKIKEVHKDEISIHVSRKGEKPVENTELLTISTDMAIRRKSDEAINTSSGVDIVDSPAYMKRVRLSSISSTNSRESASSVSSGMKEKILKWKRESTKSQKTFVISNPLELTAQSIVGENKEGSNVNEEIDKIAHERLKRYKSVDSGSELPDIESQPAIPKKPLKFHIKQLEKLLSGDINLHCLFVLHKMKTNDNSGRL